MILGRKNATLLASSFIIKSTYLLLYLSSLSVKPWNFSGSGLKDFVRSTTSFAWIEISSVLVLNTNPLIPIISPIS